MEEEIWLPVEEYIGVYEVSNLGRIRSLRRFFKDKNNINQMREGRLLKKQVINGYEMISLSSESGYKSYYVHRLVAKTFVKNDDSNRFTTVNHIDSNRSNNSVSNLEWCTQKENIRHAIKKGRMPQLRSKICI